MPSKDLDTLKEGKIDIYALLGVPSNANDTLIRKAYRKQALLYHPDKNPSEDAKHKFHHLTLAFNVLGDKKLRTEYDTWLSAKALALKRDAELGATRKRMKDELERAELVESVTRRRAGDYASAMRLEALRKDGAERRRQFEEEYLKKVGASVASSVRGGDDVADRSVKVRWKSKEGISDLFNEDVLAGIMSTFGPVESAKIIKKSKSYDTGVVVYKRSSSARDAVEHDYSTKSTLWDNTSFKRLSGLLREVKWEKKRDVPVGVLNKEEMSFEEYMDKTLMKLKKMDNLAV